MDASPRQDAARLAALAPEAHALRPAAAPSGPLSLDLRGLPPGLAMSRVERVGAWLGPSLTLADAARLEVTTGVIPPAAVAAALASSCEAIRHGGLRIAVVRGEDVLPRLEELGLAGVESSHLGRLPVAAYATAPRSVLLEAHESGAAAIVGRSLTADRSDSATTVTVLFEAGFKAGVAVRFDGPAAELIGRLESLPLDGCRLVAAEAVGMVACRVEADRHTDLVRACRRLDLVTPDAAGPIENLIVGRFEERRVTAPAGLLEFGVEVRPAAEWLDR